MSTRRDFCPACNDRVPFVRTRSGWLCQICLEEDTPPLLPVYEEPPTLGLWPVTPPSNGTDTSDAAAASLTLEQINDGHRRVLNALWRHRERGLTDEEIQHLGGLNPSTERPRRGELVEAGMVEETEERRATKSGRMAKVWKLTASALDAAARARKEQAA